MCIFFIALYNYIIMTKWNFDGRRNLGWWCLCFLFFGKAVYMFCSPMGSWIPAGYFKIDKFPIPRNEKRKTWVSRKCHTDSRAHKRCCLVDSEKKIHMHASNAVTSGPITLDVTSFSILSPSFKWKESFIFRYFKVFQLSQMFTCGLSDLLLLVSCFCIARIHFKSSHTRQFWT